jgi:hypothetical protein
MLKNVTILSAAPLMAGCANPVWHKPGASTAEFNTERYECMRGSQQQVSGWSFGRAYGGGYSGSGGSGQTTNQPLFSACMNAKGWSLHDAKAGNQRAAQEANEVKEAFASAKSRVDSICAEPRFAAIFIKTPCRASVFNYDQLNDPTKIASADKAILMEARNLIGAENKRFNGTLRRFGQVGGQLADLGETTTVRGDKNAMDLINGQLTWGQYNQRRQAIVQDHETAWARIAKR